MKTLTLLAFASLGLSSSIALAQPAKGAPAPAPDAKKAEPAPPAPKMEMPKPPKELDDAMKQMTGTWKCTGQVFMDASGKPTDTKAVITNRSDMDKWFMATNFTATMGKETYKFTGYTTYNAVEKKWYRVMVDNMGSIETNTSAGLTAGKIVWEGESRMGISMPGMPSNVTRSRHTEELTDKAIHMLGEMSMDGGKTWIKAYDANCKK
jgi:hypothetical protein